MPVTGLQTPFKEGTLLDVAREVVGLAHAGLVARSQGEEVFLQQLHAICERGYNPAEEMLRLYDAEWAGSVDPVYKTYAY